MNSSRASLINALTLIILGTASYFFSEARSFTAFIPVGAGILLLFMNRGVASGNKVIGHIAVVLTLLILIGLIKPLLGSIGGADHLILAFILLMLAGSLLSLIAFISEFIRIRKQRGGAA